MHPIIKMTYTGNGNRTIVLVCASYSYTAHRARNNNVVNHELKKEYKSIVSSVSRESVLFQMLLNENVWVVF